MLSMHVAGDGVGHVPLVGGGCRRALVCASGPEAGGGQGESNQDREARLRKCLSHGDRPPSIGFFESAVSTAGPSLLSRARALSSSEGGTRFPRQSVAAARRAAPRGCWSAKQRDSPGCILFLWYRTKEALPQAHETGACCMQTHKNPTTPTRGSLIATTLRECTRLSPSWPAMRYKCGIVVLRREPTEVINLTGLQSSQAGSRVRDDHDPERVGIR